MAAVVTSISNERWLDEVFLVGTQTNIGADDISEYSLPAGFGDCALMSMWGAHDGITTMPTLANLAFAARLLSQGDNVIGYVGVSDPFRQINVARVSAVLDPDALVLWRQAEKVQVFTPDIDAGNTIDHTYHFLVVRVRPIESGIVQPIQLVR